MCVKRKNEGGANADGIAYYVRVGCVAVAVSAAGVDEPHVVGVAGVRGTKPPVGGRAVQLRNTSVSGGRFVSRLKIGQFRAIHRKVAANAGRPAYFVTRQQEDFRRQTVRARTDSGIADAVDIRNLDLLYGILDVAIEQVQERAVQVAVDSRCLVAVTIGTVPLPFFINILH